MNEKNNITFTLVPYPSSVQQQVLQAMEVWQKVCAQEKSLKDTYQYDKGIGYEYQDNWDKTKDCKDARYSDGPLRVAGGCCCWYYCWCLC